MIGKVKTKVKKTLNKLKGKKNKKNRNKKPITDEAQDQTNLAGKEHPHSEEFARESIFHQKKGSQDHDTVDLSQPKKKEPVLQDAAHHQRHDPIDGHHERHEEPTKQVDDGHHERVAELQGKNKHEPMNKHDGIDGPYSQDNHPVLESPSRQHDVPDAGSKHEGLEGDRHRDLSSQRATTAPDGLKHEVLEGTPQVQDPYQKKHAVLAGKHELHPSQTRDVAAPLTSQDGSHDAPVASQQDSHMADHEKIERELEEQKAELEKEKAEKLKLLQEKEVFQHATTNLLQVKGQLVGDMLQLQMDMDKLQMDKMQLEEERVKREQKQIELQQERAQLQMDKDKLMKEKRILEQPGTVGKLTERVKTAFVGTPEKAEIDEIDRTVLGSETPIESKGMLTQITDKMKGVLGTGSSSTGPSPQELGAYEAGLIKAGLRTDDETQLQPEVEQKGMFATLTEKVKEAFTPVVAPEQGVLSKISQMVFGTDSGTTTTSAPVAAAADAHAEATAAANPHGLDHTLCSRSLDSIHPTKIDVDIEDNKSAIPLAQAAQTTPQTQQMDVTPQTQQTDIPIQKTTAKTKTQGRSPKKSPKKVGRRASKKNVSKAKAKTEPTPVGAKS